ncbi:MAG: hypothetical protein D8M57_04300 [Candidatus Scalindua sp. AMX11]|nr:MAG: hypothetical protein DWQ00_04295 [Candidatus Scalindua sp.]NOG84660.1 hypothetical protein [Planctomycetota bacterium]RZV92431.1 MAG: hypothetical protein EX341_05135 [Candidatus Scalindua sp. SCAELEC01]TDE66040.1 MAG: hypothetical protein D8M57_04300 [Candidatus Scalindua sp. AMX11]GJQ59011.1 MAG: hypothetical protein SCALA701_18120 [Candidatus Scalindua sp.]
MKIKLISFVVLSLLSVQSLLVAQQTKGPFRKVGQEILERAMEMVLKKDTGPEQAYDPKATPNGVRYQIDVLVYLLENEVGQDLGSPEEKLPLLIGYEEWYRAFKSVNCQDKDVPEYVERAYEFKQNMVIDYNRNRVIKETDDTDIPYLAANITLFWESPEESLSYADLESKPPLKVIYERVMTYRFLKYKEDNLVVYDQIKGLKGKALKGFLRIFGAVHMTQYRTLAVKDGPQYVLVEVAKFRWLFGSKKDLTITPDGVTLEGVPEKEKQRLHRKIKIQYEPLEPG